MDDVLGDLSSHTRRAYASDLAQVAEWCADRGIGGVEELQVGHLVAYLVELRRSGRRSSTVRRRLTAIRKLAAHGSLRLTVEALVGLEQRVTDARSDTAAALVISDDPIIRAGLRVVLTESGAVCWADATASLEPEIAASWDYVLVWLNSRDGMDPFGAIRRIRALGGQITTRLPVIAVYPGDLPALVRLRLAEAGARYAVPHSWLAENLHALARMLTFAEVPVHFHLETPLALRQQLGLRLSGDLAELLDEAASLPPEVWTGHLPQSHLPISRLVIQRLRLVALERAGVPAPDFSKYATSLRKAPRTPEWTRVRDIVRESFAIVQ